VPAQQSTINKNNESKSKKASSGVEDNMDSNKQQRQQDDACVQRKQTIARHTRRSRKQRVCKRKVRLKVQEVSI